MLQAVWKRKGVLEQQERAWVPGIAKKSFRKEVELGLALKIGRELRRQIEKNWESIIC